MKKIYFAGPLFNEADREYNAKCTEYLRNQGYTVFLPQEAGVLDEYSTTTDHLEIFKADLKAIKNADVILVNTNGTDVDSGSAVEIGIAWGLKKPVVLLHTECRGRLNNMVVQIATSCCSDIKRIPAVIEDIKM